MNFRILLTAAWVLAWARMEANAAACAEQGGVAGCDPGAAVLLCKDGSLDRQYACQPRGHRSYRPPESTRPRVLKFKPTTERGQVLLPGEKPTETTLKDSK